MRFPMVAAVAISLIIGGGAATIATQATTEEPPVCAFPCAATPVLVTTASDGTVTTNYQRPDGTVYGTVHTPDGRNFTFG